MNRSEINTIDERAEAAIAASPVMPLKRCDETSVARRGVTMRQLAKDGTNVSLRILPGLDRPTSERGREPRRAGAAAAGLRHDAGHEARSRLRRARRERVNPAGRAAGGRRHAGS